MVISKLILNCNDQENDNDKNNQMVKTSLSLKYFCQFLLACYAVW